jgi:hypothetical protein
MQLTYNRITILLSFLYFPTLYTHPTQLPFTPPLTVTGNIDKTTFFLQDANQHEFVLKYHPRGPQRAIHDTLGAYIGASINLRINKVEIFSQTNPCYTNFLLINLSAPLHKSITTLHTRVPGNAIRSDKKRDEEIYIKKGLCKEKHLQTLCEHKELCDIVAFDIFIDNMDRHNGNLFFDPKTGHFYAIDMDHAFNAAYALPYTIKEYSFITLATRAYEFISMLKKLSPDETKVLRRLAHILKKLSALYNAESLFIEWMHIAEKAHFSYSPRQQAKIRKYLKYHLSHVKRLIELIETII